MRHFPRIAQRRTTAALLAVVMAVSAMAVAAHADDLKDKKRQAEQQVAGAEKDLEHSSAELTKAKARLEAARTQLASAQSELATARGRLAVAAQRDAQMQAELEAAEAELKAAEAALKQGRVDRDAQRQELANTVSDMYMEGDPELIAFASLLDATTTEELTRRDGVRDAVVAQESRAYDELKAAEVLLTVQEEQVEKARDAVAVKREEAAANLKEKQQLEDQAEAARAAVQSLVSQRSSAQREARRIRAADAAKLRAAEREQAKIEEMLRKRAEEALRNAKGPKGPSNGLLGLPSSGYVTSPFGYRTHPIYGYWGLHNGTDFGGGCGIALRAAADGVVASAYWSDVYGNRLVIDNGAMAGRGVATIYNHASRYTVGVGARVKRGQVIGYQGTTGWSTACHLHFTVMANGTPVDPMNWF